MTRPAPHAVYIRDQNNTPHALFHAPHPPPPSPTPTQLLIRVHAFAVSQADLPPLALTPPTLPAVAGRQAAGVVVQVGQAVSAFQQGDRVAVLADAAWADFIAVDVACVANLTPHLSWAEAAVLFGATTLAVHAVQIAALSQGQRIVVVGAASAVGSAIVQVAKMLANASVIAVVSGEQEFAIAKKLCPVHVIDQSKQKVSDALKKSPVHVAFDTIGVGHRLSAVVRRGGWIIQAGEYRPSAALHARRRQDKLGRMCRRRGVRAATAQMDARPELLRVAREVVDKVRVPHGPCFGVREYARAVAVAEEGVGSGMVVVLL